ncbi:MAG: hypothetical protein ACLFVJ_19715 [Persicimonas sp.]
MPLYDRDHDEHLQYGAGQIMQAAGAHFIQRSRRGPSFRSLDAGQSWEELPSAPHSDEAVWLKSDGQSLFAVEEIESDNFTVQPSLLWRSEDQGETWQVIREDIDSAHVRVTEAFIVAAVMNRDGGAYVRSDDGGDSWEEIGAPYDDRNPFDRLGETRWSQFQDKLLTTTGVGRRDDERGVVGVVNETGLVDRKPLDGLEASAHLVDVVPCGDELYGVVVDWHDDEPSVSARLGQITSDVSRFDSLELPWSAGVRRAYETPGAQCLGDGSLLVLTDMGALQTDDRGESWELVGSPFSTPDYAIEIDERLHTGEFEEGMWRLGSDDEWQPVVLPEPFDNWRPDDVYQDNGSVFLTTARAEVPGVYLLEDEGQRATPIWTAQMAADELDGLEFVADGDVLAVAEFPDVGQRESTIYLSFDAGQTFEPLPDMVPPPMSYDGWSMRLHDGALWVVDEYDKIWRADLSTGQWQQTVDGMPEDADHLRLRSTDGGLFGFSRQRVFAWDGERWGEVSSDRMRDALGILPLDEFAGRGDGIVDVIADGGRLVVATRQQIGVLDTESRRAAPLELEHDRPIISLFSLPAGLYASLGAGGLRRFSY